jgi:hypothetical protein
MVCETVYNGAATTMADVFNCGIGSLFGYDYVLVAIAIIAVLLVLGYKFRLPAGFALVMGWGVVYMLDLMAGGNQNLQIIMVLLIVGIGAYIIMGVLHYGKEYA